MRARDLGVAALLALLLDLVQAPPVVLLRLLLELLELRFEIGGSAAPGIAIGLELLLLPLEVCERFLQSLRKLLLGKEMLLDCSDPRFLVLLNLRECKILAGRPASR